MGTLEPFSQPSTISWNHLMLYHLTYLQVHSMITSWPSSMPKLKTFTRHWRLQITIHPLCTLCPPSALHLLASNCQLTGLILKSKSSTCQLDHLPTYLVKSCLPGLCSVITDINHSSLTSGVVPSSLKTAAITPTIKKPGADLNDLNNFCPISNLPFISKIL